MGYIGAIGLNECIRVNGRLCRMEGGSIRWLNEDILTHREDGPAFEHVGGTKSWWINGEIHKIDGPAIERPIGQGFPYFLWYLNGFEYPFEEWLKKTPISIEEKALLKLKYG